MLQRLSKITNSKCDEIFMVMNQIVTTSYEMDANFKFMSVNIHFRFTSLDYLAVKAKRVDKFDIRRNAIYLKFNDIQICN